MDLEMTQGPDPWSDMELGPDGLSIVVIVDTPQHRSKDLRAWAVHDPEAIEMMRS